MMSRDESSARSRLPARLGYDQTALLFLGATYLPPALLVAFCAGMGTFWDDIEGGAITVLVAPVSGLLMAAAAVIPPPLMFPCFLVAAPLWIGMILILAGYCRAYGTACWRIAAVLAAVSLLQSWILLTVLSHM